MSFDHTSYEAQVFFWFVVLAAVMLVAAAAAAIAAWHGYAFTAAIAAFVSGVLLSPALLVASEFIMAATDE